MTTHIDNHHIGPHDLRKTQTFPLYIACGRLRVPASSAKDDSVVLNRFLFKDIYLSVVET